MPYTYALEDLYNDHAQDVVEDLIAPVMAWISPTNTPASPVCFDVQWTQATGGLPQQATLAIEWDLAALEHRDSRVGARADRLRVRRTVGQGHKLGTTYLTEKLTENAACGLALVATAVFLQERVVACRIGLPPDLLFDDSPGRFRGVEVEGRATGGFSTLSSCQSAKVSRVTARVEVVEAHLSLWCASPEVTILCKVKP